MRRDVDVPDHQPSCIDREPQVRLCDRSSLLCGSHPLQQLFGTSPCGQQLMFIFSTVGRDEHGDLVRHCVSDLALQCIHEHGDRPAIAVNEVELDLCNGSLQLKQRQPMSLMKDPATHRQQILHPLL
jgi:hypothetical protein